MPLNYRKSPRYWDVAWPHGWVLGVGDGYISMLPPIAGGDGGGDTTVSQRGDPIAEAINRIRLGGIETGLRSRGGADPFFGSFFSFDPRSQPGGRELDILGQLSRFADRPAVGALDAEAMNLIRSSFDTGTARETLEQIVGPQLINQLTASGMGRSGAAGEALAGAGARLALPLQQMRARAGGQLFDIGRLLEGRELGRLQTGLQAAGVPRQAELAEFRRPLDLIQSLMGASFIPQGATMTQTTEGPSLGTLFLGNLLGQAGKGLGSAITAPFGAGPTKGAGAAGGGFGQPIPEF